MARANSRDSGIYTCSVDNRSEAIVSVHVIQGEKTGHRIFHIWKKNLNIISYTELNWKSSFSCFRMIRWTTGGRSRTDGSGSATLQFMDSSFGDWSCDILLKLFFLFCIISTAFVAIVFRFIWGGKIFRYSIVYYFFLCIYIRR